MKTVSMFLALALAAFAADNPPVMSQLRIVEIPSDTAAEFAAVQRDIAQVYKDNKAPIPRLAWTSLTGTPKFVMVTPLAGLDKIGGSTWLGEQGTENARQARWNRLRNASGQSSSKIITDVNGTNWESVPGSAPAPFIAATIHEVKPGKGQEFVALMTQYSEVVKKMGKAKSFFIARTSYGASWGEYHVVIGYASLADIPTSGGAMRAVMGETAATAWSEKISACVNSSTRDLYRFRSEYSYLPPKPAK